jgi:hypothetical protein
MTASPTAPTARELRGNFVLLRADTLRLLLPQHDVGAATHLDAAPRPTDLAGFFEHGDEAAAQPVVALSSDMLPLAQFPPDRFFVTSIATPLGEIGFGWSEVSVLLDARLQAQPLPAALFNAQTALREFVEIDGRVVFCCDSTRMADHAFANAGLTA